jgi:hypothetical protein
LQHAEEVRELGMAIFLDRPFGVFKPAAEPDRTLLLSYEAFSHSLAEQRLQNLADDPALNLSAAALQSYRHTLQPGLAIQGIPIMRAKRATRPAAVALEDAAKVAGDFVVLRTTRRAVQDFLHQFDCTALAERLAVDYLVAEERLLIVRAAATRSGQEGILDIYDATLQRRLELQIDPGQGYRQRAGQEFPAAGLRVLRAWDTDGSEIPLPKHSQGIILPPQK